MFKDKVVIITGAAQGIGAETAKYFTENHAIVLTFDLKEPADFIGDLSKKEDLEDFANFVIQNFRQVDYLINNAAPQMKGINDCSYEEFLNALQVGTVAPFYLTKLFRNHFTKNAVIINLSSTRSMMSQSQSESYTAAKGGIQALTHALSVSLSGIARVNCISPGWIDTTENTFSKEDYIQHPTQTIGKPRDIAELIGFLCSDKASFINGENITIDGGMSKLMIYHNDNGWKFHT